MKRSTGDKQGELSSLLDIGRALVSTGNYGEAEKTSRQAVRLGKKLKEEKGLSAAYDLQAEALLLSGKPEKALKVLDTAERESGQSSGVRLNLRGLALIKIGKNGEAFKVLMSALDANRGSGDKAGLARSYRALGLAAMASQSPDALSFFREAYRLDREAGDMKNVGYGLGKMAEISLEKGRQEEAVFLFERSYAAYMEAGSKEGALSGLDSLIEALRALGQDEKALYYSAIKEDILKKMEGGRRDR
ncbi:MAG: tetratricopeptide repeat protein [Deltaproteobacteria bacterium]|nr:tetratricopeptide repeat protein [Deltaproteobacteria bacterium]MBZ0218913.1 tetratricopeptide repeat protein [Deltaproteobacteria bacterium]